MALDFLIHLNILWDSSPNCCAKYANGKKREFLSRITAKKSDELEYITSNELSSAFSLYYSEYFYQNPALDFDKSLIPKNINPL